MNGALPIQVRRRLSALLLVPGVSLAGVAACTWVSFRLGLGLATVGFLYLVIVLLTAVYSGFRVATIVSLAAVTCLNYFFVDPIFTFRVNSLEDFVALCSFELTALVVSRLSHLSKQRAAEALTGRRESERLYRTARRIMLFGPVELGPALTAAVREIFELDAVILFDAMSVTTHRSGAAPGGAEERTRSAYLTGRNDFDPATGSWYCTLHAEARPMGGLALCGGAMSRLAAHALASLCASALNRAQSVERECRAEAARQGEQLRSAVLDALGHEFKTPVTTIWTASSGLLALGGLSELQNELVTLIDEQSKKLNDLSSRLLTTARLDRGDFQPRCEPILCSNLIHSVIRALGSGEALERIQVEASSSEERAWADPKLLAAALAQLLDNAMKYSTPASTIQVDCDGREGRTVISVRSQGAIIPPSDRERIFERFYRAYATEDGPAGTGLGLSIVKRIALAHEGRVWVESEPARGTVFFLALPAAPKSADDDDSEGLRAGADYASGPGAVSTVSAEAPEDWGVS
ncbi:MAG TPA: ATP-binding protein [Bryobacteraceae bacterium]|nr:ATP-binding protein [Bryobacteraceae bacterium]